MAIQFGGLLSNIKNQFGSLLSLPGQQAQTNLAQQQLQAVQSRIANPPQATNISPTTQQNALNTAIKPQIANQPTPNAIPGASSAPVPTSVQPNNPDLSQFGASLNNLRTQAETLQKTINSQATPQSTYADLQKQYLGQLTPSAQENALNSRINDLLGKNEANSILLGGAPGSAWEVQGQRTSLDRETQAQLVPLQRSLSTIQGQRMAAADIVKTELGFAQEANKPLEVAPGSSLIKLNPQTGKYETAYQAQAKLPEDYATAKSEGFTGGYLDFLKQKKEATSTINIMGGGTPLGSSAMDIAAQTYLATGQLPNIGTGIVGSQYRAQVLERAAQLAQQAGITGYDIAGQASTYKSDTAALQNISKFLASADAFEQKAISQTKIVSDLSSKVDRTGSPLVNKYVLWVKGQVAGDTDTQMLQNAITTFATEYAKIMTGSTSSAAPSTDSARKEAEDLIKSAMGKGTIASQLELMKKEMNLSIQGFKSTKQGLQSGLSNPYGLNQQGGDDYQAYLKSIGQ